MASSRLFPTLKQICVDLIVKDSLKLGTVENRLVEAEQIPANVKEDLQNAYLKPVMSAVVQGDVKNTEELIKARPRSLLSAKSETIDLSGRTIKYLTPFQAALCGWDIEMCEMLKTYMSDEEVASQFKEIFPQGFDQYYDALIPYDFNKIVDAITQSTAAEVTAQLQREQTESPLAQVFKKFRKDFTQISCAEIVFNPKHILKSFEAYDNQFDVWDQNKRDLFWRQVIGYLQRYMSAKFAQDYAQGLYQLVEGNKPAKRSFNYNHGGGAIFPITFDTSTGLGFEHACSFLGSKSKREWFKLQNWMNNTSAYADYIEKNLQELSKYSTITFGTLNKSS